ncbi:hypothetical protein GCM10011584_07130 [Nocardioides phosphati]|uniref:Uncharacterized protein n=1 Tax=Nocardioides phosphati TaxID=1867775 RepID=A0ABQ2NBH7_9ACTN|nr:hypothetical protein [Nocardioides phosphati]GGO85955.1 hypothetical protein GCM10011584_07130 [Nocardioides phosphati]
MEALLVLLGLSGIVALGVGVSLRNRQIHAEHWLWKKQRLARSRFLLTGGSALTAVSAVAFFLV